MPKVPVPGGKGATKPNKYYNHGNNHGEYGYVDLQEIINNFTATYVGTGKILEGTLKGDVAYHAHRALQELSYDTLKSCKAISITLPPSLIMTVPHDYVNYTKITYADSSGIERLLYPTSKTSHPDKIQQDDDGNYLYNDRHQINLLQNEFELKFDINKLTPAGNSFTIKPRNPYGVDDTVTPAVYTDGTVIVPGQDSIEYNAMKHPLEVGMEIFAPGIFPPGTKVASITGPTLQSSTGSQFTFTADKPSINQSDLTGEQIIFKNYTSSTVWGKYKNSGSHTQGIDPSINSSASTDLDNYFDNRGQRYGLDPQHAQANGSFFIDCKSGKIFFSSNLSGKQIVLHYISDGHGTNEELIVPKLAEEAMYKWIAYGCLSAKADVSEGVVQRYKREKFAETRKAKIRLSNIKIEEIAQVMRGKSKFIDH
tara:strand:+ start:31 stop:1305 length:1275 start_codon:yes stop_codon:yes gene_type:complete